MSHKINRILAVIFAACLAICLRTLHLGVVEREAKLIEAQKPQSRTILQRADRGTISDRFGIPLALNRICYNAVIYYGQIAQIPYSQWKEETDGKKIRVYPRKDYIRALAKVLGSTLGESPERLEDLIHSKASLFPHAPYLVKSRLSEEEHYRLKSLEKDWPGIHAETAAERFYPLGKVACHILGTMGKISQKKYSAILEELSTLQEAVESYEEGQVSTLPTGTSSFEEAAAWLKELKEKAYTLNDSVGKSGIEAEFEEELRGFFGKKTFEVDQKGRFIRELAGGKAPVPGRQVVLSISAELQQFAEELLAESEKDRDGRIFGIDPADKKRKILKQPWIKGGAIVALDPKSGEVLAMASFPRFDPNDFIAPAHSNERICRWLENEKYIGSVWDKSAHLVKERFEKQKWIEEESILSWDLYLDLILPKDGPLRAFFQKCDHLKLAIQVQEDFEMVRYFSGQREPIQVMEDLFATPAKLFLDGEAGKSARRLEALLGPIPTNADRLFAIDLCRVAVDSTRFSDELIAKLGSLSLSTYSELGAAFLKMETKAKDEEAARFRNNEFRIWREANQKEFLAEKRKGEKERKTYARPYIDYLDQKERQLFNEHWNALRLSILQKRVSQESKLLSAVKDLSSDLTFEFLRTFRSFKDLDRPLLGKYKKFLSEKDLAASFYPQGGFGYLRSFAFQSNVPQGSLFKIVTAYEGLRQGHSPVIIDESGRNPKWVAYTPNGTPYPRMYKGGRLPRSSNPQVGKIDIVGALERTSNPYFSILAGDFMSDPEDLKTAAARFGYGEKSGLDLPGEASGLLPNDLKTNRTSLYSFAFGQHTLLCTPLQTSIMLSTLANGGKILKPKIAKMLTGLAPDREMLSIFDVENGFAKAELRALGIPFSLFTGVQAKEPVVEIGIPPTEVRREIPLPPEIRAQLFEGMDRSMWSPNGSARASAIRSLRLNQALLDDYLSLQHQVIGKTSTAEILYQANVNPSSKAHMTKYIWFGALSFSPEYPIKIRYDHPELAVVVFLRFGNVGKDAAPLAAQMVKKWREIKKKHEENGV